MGEIVDCLLACLLLVILVSALVHLFAELDSQKEEVLSLSDWMLIQN